MEIACLAGGNITEDILFRRNKEKQPNYKVCMTFDYFFCYFFMSAPVGTSPEKSGTFHANLYDFIRFCVYKLEEFILVVFSKHNKSHKSNIFLF